MAIVNRMFWMIMSLTIKPLIIYKKSLTILKDGPNLYIRKTQTKITKRINLWPTQAYGPIIKCEKLIIFQNLWFLIIKTQFLKFHIQSAFYVRFLKVPCHFILSLIVLKYWWDIVFYFWWTCHILRKFS